MFIIFTPGIQTTVTVGSPFASLFMNQSYIMQTITCTASRVVRSRSAHTQIKYSGTPI